MQSTAAVPASASAAQGGRREEGGSGRRGEEAEGRDPERACSTPSLPPPTLSGTRGPPRPLRLAPVLRAAVRTRRALGKPGQAHPAGCGDAQKALPAVPQKGAPRRGSPVEAASSLRDDRRLAPSAGDRRAPACASSRTRGECSSTACDRSGLLANAILIVNMSCKQGLHRLPIAVRRDCTCRTILLRG